MTQARIQRGRGGLAPPYSAKKGGEREMKGKKRKEKEDGKEKRKETKTS